MSYYLQADDTYIQLKKDLEYLDLKVKHIHIKCHSSNVTFFIFSRYTSLVVYVILLLYKSLAH